MRILIVPSLLLVAIVLSGCMASEADASLPDPSDVPVPTWGVGQWWKYNTTDGEWLHYKVEGIEEHQGYSTYRLLVETPPDPYIHPTGAGTQWVDTESLGWVAFQTKLYFWNDCPQRPIFPMANYTHNCTTYQDGYEENYHYDVAVEGWDTVDTTWGKMKTIHTISTFQSGEIWHAWYSPDVENFIKFTGTSGKLLTLQDWGVKPPESE